MQREGAKATERGEAELLAQLLRFSSKNCDGSGAEGRRASRDAVFWRDGEMIPLGYLAGGPFYDEAHSVSADGTPVVGEAQGAVEETFVIHGEDGQIDRMRQRHESGTESFVAVCACDIDLDRRRI